MPEEFKRALSLIKQRTISKMGDKVGDFSMNNCLDIQYANLDNVEGLFTFDENKSSMDRLTIL